MACSPEQLAANRRNSLLSTGPRTTEGKEKSRRNALKHGLTGAGIVVADEDVEAVTERFDILHHELAPATAMGILLVQRIALMSVRLDRSARQEAKKINQSMRLAPEKHEDRRHMDAIKLISWIAAEPASNVMLLKRTPEGVDHLIHAWVSIDKELEIRDPAKIAYGQWLRVENLNGLRPEDYPISRDGALFKTVWGQTEFLEPGELETLDHLDAREWAVDRIRERIAAKLVELRALRATFDDVEMARDRDEAAQRALFDPSKEGILARQYEAATERSMYRALKELRQIEADAASRPSTDTTVMEQEVYEELASNFEEPVMEVVEEPTPAPIWYQPARKSVRKTVEKPKKSRRSGRSLPG